MVAAKAKFDGEKIVAPEGLRGTTPREVIVVFDEPTGDADRPSIFDFIGKSGKDRSAEDIDAQIREERDSWGAR